VLDAGNEFEAWRLCICHDVMLSSVCSVCRKSLDLIDILLQLADEGFQALVLELFKFPVQYCPDLLLLGLLQIVRIILFRLSASKLLNFDDIIMKS